MLHDQDAVPPVAQPLQQPYGGLDVGRVQPDRGLVDQVGHLDQAGTQVLDHLDPLRFAARQGRGRPGQGEVAEPDGGDRVQPGGQRVDHRRHLGGGDGADETGQFADLQPGQLADRVAEQGGRTGGLVEPVPVALQADLRAGEPADHLLLAFRQVVGGVQVDPLEPLDHPLVRLGWLAAQPRRGLAAVQQRRPFLRAPLTQRGVRVEGADVGVLGVPVAAVAEPGQPDRPLRQRPVQVEKAVDGGGHHLAEARAGRAHAGRIVEGEPVRLAHLRCAHPGEEQPQVGPGVGDGADRRAGVAAEPALVDHDHRGQPAEVLDVRAGPLRQPVTGERREGLVELVTRLGGDGVEHQRRLARPGHAGEDDQPVARDVDVECGQVVGAGAPDGDVAMLHAADATSRCGRILTAIEGRMGLWPM
ncbi:hypothetical protein ACGFJ5_06100 [Micromonospora echinaurantiaca]|uniref:hypothetical protein n=1 Tax=Micromonospora echinaurantiaca TaxID=47857 RepID=UPI00371CF52B